MRPRGGYIGFNRVPAAAAVNSAASGVWTLREAEALKRAGTWPQVFYNPSSLTGLQLWLDAADASTLYDATTGGSLVAADGTVARWEDKSGNARHATQGTAANRPARRSSVVNSLDALDFDGSNDGLFVNSLSSMFSGVNKAFTVIAVARTDVTNSTQDCLSAAKDDNNDENVRAVWNNGSQKLQIAREEGVGASTTKSVSGSTSLGTALKVAAWTFDGTNGRVFLNKTSDGTAANIAHAGDIVIDRVAVGFLPRLIPAVYFNGYICEVLVYDTAISDVSRNAAEDYLIAKWGIT